MGVINDVYEMQKKWDWLGIIVSKVRSENEAAIHQTRPILPSQQRNLILFLCQTPS